MFDNESAVPQTILYATDLREDRHHHVPFVAAIARAFHQSLTVLSVIESEWKFSNAVLDQMFHEQHLQVVRQRAESLCSELKQMRVECESILLKRGSAVETICETAVDLNSSLILLGAGEPEAQDRLGVTATAVLESAKRSVLVMKPRRDASSLATIVCPIDNSRPSRDGLEAAIRIARGAEAKLVVLSVVPQVSWLTAAAETGEFREAHAEYEAHWAEGIDEFLRPVDFGGVSWEHKLIRGAASEQIVATAKEADAALIVMGATGRSGLVRVLLGSTTRRVLRSMPCSMLVVRENS